METKENYNEITKSSILFINIRSLKKNYHKLVHEINNLKHKPIIIALQELWTPHPTQLYITGYHKLEHFIRVNKKGGGVGIFVREDINYENIGLKQEEEKQEIIAVKLKDHNYVVLNIYKPPHLCTKTFFENLEDNIHTIQKINKQHTTIIGGDFNVNINKIGNKSEIFHDFCTRNNFRQLIRKPTRHNLKTSTLIDNILLNSATKHDNGVLDLEIADHLAMYINIPLKHKVNKPQNNKSLTRINIDNLKADLRDTKWNIEEFTKQLESLIKSNTSTITFKKSKHKIEAWMTKGLLKSRSTKIALIKNYTKAKLPERKTEAKKKLKEYNKIYYKLIREAKRTQLAEEINKNYKNGKKIWEITNTYINRRKNQKPSMDELQIGQHVYKEPMEIAEHINKHFATIGNKIAQAFSYTPKHMEHLPRKTYPKLIFQKVQPKETKEIIAAMKSKVSKGLDEMNNKLIKEIANEIIDPLTEYINLMITKKEFPNEWKRARVIPLFKSGKQNDPNNYRPISLLPTLSKVFEKIIDRQIRDHLENNQILSNKQYGFRPKHETLHAHLDYLNNIETKNRKGLYGITVLADLRKAFDVVNHSILADKLEHYGIENTLIKNYLSNRTQQTEVHGQISTKENITCGVPQGSILGPLLFLIYINDLPECTTAHTILYADDTTFTFHHKNKTGLQDMANNELKKIASWFQDNHLTVHKEKTVVLPIKKTNKYRFDIRINGNLLPQIGTSNLPTSVKFLGLHIEPEHNWKTHINNVIKKVRSNSFLIGRYKYILPYRIKLLIYNSLIKPYLEYSNIIWGFSGIGKLLIEQRRIIRLINCLNRSEHTEKYFSANNILKFKDLRDLNCIKLGRKTIDKDIPIGIANIFKEKESRRNTRSNDNSDHLKIPNNYNNNSVTYRLPLIWNETDQNTKQITDIDKLKRYVKKLKIWEYSQFNCTASECYSCAMLQK